MPLTRRRFLLSTLGAALSARCSGGGGESPSAPTGGEAGSGTVLLQEDFAGRSLFPPDNWWNQDIRDAPIDRDSAEFLDFIGRTRRLHPDFGPPPFGIPYVSVSRTQPLVPVRFVDYPEESDAGAPGRGAGYPIPEEAKTSPNFIEGGVPGGGDDSDRHLLLVDRDQWLLYETWATRWNAGERAWEAGSGAVFDMNRSDRRPEGFTSADAAGLAILPGLVRHDEVFGTSEIRHAFRVTVRRTNGYVFPASHRAGDTPGALPMGARLRLRATVDLSSFSAPLAKIFQAMKRYGLIVADNGSDLYITGTMDSRWNNDELNPSFGRLTASDFDVIELGWM